MSGVIVFDLTKKVQSSLLGINNIPSCHNPNFPTVSSHNNNNNGVSDPTETRQQDTVVEMLKLMLGDWPSVCVSVYVYVRVC